jgi:alpha-beta hydrolase superfamily lysophospholipase
MEIAINYNSKDSLKGFANLPGGDTKRVIILIHGLGDHIGRYTDWGNRFSESGYAFMGVDLPGSGISAGRRGHIDSFNTFHRIIDQLIDKAAEILPGIPVIIYGHSLGGTIVLDYLKRNSTRVKASIITSPWLKLDNEPTKAQVILAKVISKIYPGFTQANGLKAEDMSSDEEMTEQLKGDPLVHRKISVGTFLQAVEAAENILSSGREYSLPILMMHGADDRVTSPEGSKIFAAASGNTHLNLWEGGYHELHREPFRNDVFAYIIEWLAKI